ncbi:hypothetical protein [Streptomyces violascens]|uniref:hypothetical protein n=1 Tax=Streptomyces violascens TaxID=67381 RepID=UPI0036B6B611
MRLHGEDLGRINETGLAVFRRRRIGMIFQFVNLIDDLPAIDNTALAAQLTGTPRPSGPAQSPSNCSTSSASPTAGTSTRPPSAAAGPFPQAVVDLPRSVAEEMPGMGSGPVTVVGRADPEGSVDHLNLFAGHWATGPGERVLALPDAPGMADGPHSPLGKRIQLPGLAPLTVVGLASSVSGTAQARVSPQQIEALHPSTYQMLYRSDRAATSGQIAADTTSVTSGLPSGPLVSHQSYLTLKAQVAPPSPTRSCRSSWPSASPVCWCPYWSWAMW